MTLETVKVFKVETDYVVAETRESAVDYYLAMIGEPERRLEVENETSEVSREFWPNMEIVDMDTIGRPRETFQQAIEGMLTWKNQEYPKTLATTEY